MTERSSPRRFRKRPERSLQVDEANDNHEQSPLLVDDDSHSEPDWSEDENDDAEDSQADEEDFIDEEDLPRPNQARSNLKRPRAGGVPVSKTASSRGPLSQLEGQNVVSAEDLQRLPGFEPLPSFTNVDDYNAWAQTVINSMVGHSEDNLHPILSFIYPPWNIPEYNDDLVDDNGKVSHTAGGSTKVLKDIPWLPSTIPGPRSGGSAGWQLAIYEMLGAHPAEIVKRIPADDEVWGDTLRARKSDTRNRKQLESLVRRRIDLFSKSRGRLCRLTGPKVNGGKLTKQISETLDGKTDLQLYLNCAWTLDLSTRTMRQPNSRVSVPYRLYQPVYPTVWENYLEEVNELGMNLPVPAKDHMLRKYPALIEDIVAFHVDDASAQRPAKKRKVQNTGDLQLAPLPLAIGHDPICNGLCPVCCSVIPEVGQDQEVVHEPEACPSLHMGDASDDTLWETQWTQEQENEWKSIVSGEIDEHTRWPLGQQYGSPAASHFPRFPL